MRTENSDNKKDYASKLHEDQKKQNNQVFYEVCYLTFIEKIKAHYNVVQFIMKCLEQISLDNSNKEKQKLSEEEYAKSILSYNESIKNLLLSEYSNIKPDIANRVANLMREILDSITKLTDHIQHLNKVIVEISKEIENIKEKLSNEIKRIFNLSNQEINFQSKSLQLLLPSKLRCKPGMERFQMMFNIDFNKELYIKAAQRLADMMNSDDFSFDSITIKVNEAIKEIIKEEIAAIVNQSSRFLSQELQEEIIDELINQNKTQKEIKSLKEKLVRDISSKTSLAQLIDEGCKNERGLKKAKAEKEVIIDMIAHLQSHNKNIKNSLSNPAHQPASRDAIIATAEAEIIKFKNFENSTFRLIESAIAETDKLVTACDHIREEARHESPSSTSEITLTKQYADKIDQAVSPHDQFLQDSLADLLKSYEDPSLDPDTDPKPTLTSMRP